MIKSSSILVKSLFSLIFMMSLAGAQETPNKNYEIVLEPQYSEANEFIAGLATVVIGTPMYIKWSVINREGQVIMEFGSRDEVSPRELRISLREYLNRPDGIRRFIKAHEWLYVDRQGKIINRTVRDPDDERPYAVVDMAEDELRLIRAINMKKKWGYKNIERKTVIDFQFDDAHPFSEDMAAVKKDKQWGFINREGNFAIEPQFEKVEDFVGGLARVRKNKLWGLVNAEGAFVADCQYQEIGDFSEGMAPVKQTGKWGYINDQGRLLVDCIYNEVSAFSDGKAKVRLKGWGVIDKAGNIVVKPEYSALGDFYEGMLAVCPGAGYNYKWGFVNDQGEVVIKPIFQDVTHFNHEGVAIVKDKDLLGLVDKKGHLVLEPKYSYLNVGYYYVSSGMAVSVQLESESLADDGVNDEIRKLIQEISEKVGDLHPILQYEGKWGFINNKGTIVIDCIYDDVRPFSEGLAAVRVKDKWGYINKNGDFAIHFKYVDAHSFSEGLAAVNMTSGILKAPKYGFINKEGNLVIDYEFSNAGKFSEGLAPVPLNVHKPLFSEAVWAYIQIKK